MFNIFPKKIKLPKSFCWFERKPKNNKLKDLLLKEVIEKLYKDGYEKGYKQGYGDGINGDRKNKEAVK